MGQILIEHFHGAATRVHAGETALPLRDEGYNFLALSQWMDPAESNRCIAWAREAYAQMAPHLAAARYVNYLDHLDNDETGDPIATAYGSNYRRLQEIKTRYDPTNFFHLNQNIRPLS